MSGRLIGGTTDDMAPVLGTCYGWPRDRLERRRERKRLQQPERLRPLHRLHRPAYRLRSDGFTRLTWVSTGSVLSFWHMALNITMLSFNIYGPYF